MSRDDRSCTLCGSRAHSVQSCPWAKEGWVSAVTADCLEKAIVRRSVDVDTALRLIHEIFSPSKGATQ